MTKEEFKLGLKVRHRPNDQIGAIVFDCFGLCNNTHALVEFDGLAGTLAVRCEDLEPLEMLTPKIDHNKCNNCVFYTGAHCLRYAAGSMAILLSSKNGKQIPSRIYPLCQSA